MRSRRLPIVLLALALVAGAAAIWIVRGALEPDPREPVEAFLGRLGGGPSTARRRRGPTRRGAAAPRSRPTGSASTARASRPRTLEVSEREDSAEAAGAAALGRARYRPLSPTKPASRCASTTASGACTGPPRWSTRSSSATRGWAPTRAPFERAPILDRDGVPIVRERPVVRVGAVVEGRRGSRGPRPPGWPARSDVDRRAAPAPASQRRARSSSSRRSSCGATTTPRCRPRSRPCPTRRPSTTPRLSLPRREFARGAAGHRRARHRRAAGAPGRGLRAR